MSNKLFTEEEITELRTSQYVQNVTVRSLTFTAEFKKIAYRELLKGTPVHEIFESHGISANILGTGRINNFIARLREKGERDEGFTDLRHQRRMQTPEERNLTAEKRIRQLEAELAYTRQEVEFLKKVQAADMEARKAWESKHRQK